MPKFYVAATILRVDDIHGAADLSTVLAPYPAANASEAMAKCRMEIAQRMPDYQVMDMKVLFEPN